MRKNEIKKTIKPFSMRHCYSVYCFFSLSTRSYLCFCMVPTEFIIQLFRIALLSHRFHIRISHLRQHSKAHFLDFIELLYFEIIRSLSLPSLNCVLVFFEREKQFFFFHCDYDQIEDWKYPAIFCCSPISLHSFFA